MSSKIQNTGKLMYVWDPPDGGWGYMIALGLVLLFTFTMNTFFGFGLIYGDFLKERGDEITATTFIHGVFGTMFSFMGLLTNKLLQQYSLRFVGIIGSIIYFTGALLCVFVQNVTQLVFTFGFLQGIGYGLMLPVVFTAFNQYFVRRRTVMNSISQGLMTAASLILPVITQFFMDNYGQRGTALIFAALSLHALFSVILFQPVEWHMVKRIQEVEIGGSIDKESITAKKSENEKTEKLSFGRTIYNTLDLSLLEDFQFFNLVNGCAIAFVAEICIINVQPSVLVNRGFSSQSAAFIVTLSLVGDLAARIVQVIFNIFVIIKSRYLVLFGLLMTGISRLVFGLATDLTLLAGAAIAGGFFRSWIHMPLPVAIAENCTLKRFPAAYGLYMIGTGIFNILIPFFLALLPQNNTITVVVLSLLVLFAAMSWILEIIWLNCCRSKSYKTSETFTMNTFFGFGLIYGEFLKERGDEVTATTFIHGVFGTTFSFMGLFTNKLLTQHSLRFIGIIGAMIYFSGAFLSVFVQNVAQLVFTFGFLQGVGYGLMTPVVVTGFNQYFVKRRTVMNSITQGSMTGVTLILPVITQILMDNYGQRGTAAIFAALSLNALFGMVLYQPVEWHMVKQIQDNEIEIEKFTTETSKEFEVAEEVKKVSFGRTIYNMLDLSLLKDLRFLNLVNGCAIAFVAEVCIGNVQPAVLLNRGFSAQTTAFIVTLYLSGDFSARVLQMFFSAFISMKSRYLVLFGLLMTGISRLVFGLTTNLTITAAAAIAGGVFRSWIHVPLPVAIAESCTLTRFPAAYGLYMIGTGIFNVLLPFFLALFPQDDSITVVVLSLLLLFAAISWILEIIWFNCCRSKN
ncbi:uncharacterized protein LOC123292923 [Chrysoperla carnea]|uniref:uncharacterized protein LOC123292923 n=1 Tax=Chrysoperla carnea TaxID=189513 RepID=UPI001D06218F|nr:uncharacterized protein LOC123292923 [Chrysoperla carnea]